MVSVTLGAKAKNYNFDVNDIDMSTIDTSPSRTSISGNGALTLYSDKKNYVTLEGDFNLMKMGDPEQGIKHLDAITVVENGAVSYSASHLDMVGSDFKSAAAFEEFIASQSFSIKGNAYANEIVGAGQKDVLHGMGGNDILTGMAGNDKLFGEDGVDTISGGEGKDILTGGKGLDLFIFASGDGHDTIVDFDAKGNAHEQIDLSGVSGVSSFHDLDISVEGKDIVITFDGEDSLTLKKVNINDLDAGDFIF